MRFTMRAIVKMAAVAIAAATPLAASAADQTPQDQGFSGTPIADEELQRAAGREDVAQIAQADQAATVTRNNVGDNSRTGAVQIADNAFQNLSGLSVLNVNTGNNVAINAAMNVNISLPTQ